MPEHQIDPLIQLLKLSMADIEQGHTYSLSEALSALEQSRPLPAQSGSGDWSGFFDAESASPDFLTEREDVITEREPGLDELPPDENLAS